MKRLVLSIVVLIGTAGAMASPLVPGASTHVAGGGGQHPARAAVQAVTQARAA